MQDILFASVPIHGHVAPLLPLVRHFVQRGDRVRFITGSRFAEAVRDAGAEHIALTGLADFDDRTVVENLPPGRDGLSPVKAIAFDMEHIFIRPVRDQYAAVRAALGARPADALIVDPTFFAGSVIAALPAAERPPVIVAGVLPLSYPSRDVAPFGTGTPPMPGVLGRLRNAVLATMTRTVVFGRVQRVADEVQCALIGIPMGWPFLEWLPHADAVIQLAVPSFEYPRPDAPDTLHFTGPAFAPTSGHGLPDWWGDLDAAPSVVHVTQGTIANDDLTELILPTIRGLAGGDVLVVVSTGGVPVDRLGELPPNVRAAEFLPYAELFAHTDVFVTNGGYGGTQFALSHGVPIVVAPGKEDKVEVAARVAWSGVGINLKTQRPTPDAIAAAVNTVLEEPRFRAAAQRIGADIEASPGAAGFAETVDRVIASHSSAHAWARQ